jgi:hypothetical protein
MVVPPHGGSLFPAGGKAAHANDVEEAAAAFVILHGFSLPAELIID